MGELESFGTHLPGRAGVGLGTSDRRRCVTTNEVRTDPGVFGVGDGVNTVGEELAKVGGGHCE